MKFTWDPKKNRANQRKHAGYDFHTGTLVFSDPRHLIEFDRMDDDGEERLHAIGRLPNGVVPVVVHTDKRA
jgi:uncharacterized DUF497 family protein